LNGRRRFVAQPTANQKTRVSKRKDRDDAVARCFTRPNDSFTELGERLLERYATSAMIHDRCVEPEEPKPALQQPKRAFVQTVVRHEDNEMICVAYGRTPNEGTKDTGPEQRR
jgi:hypothetical protein